MSVDARHPEYQNNIERVRIVRDCVIGSSAIKSRIYGGSGMWGQKGTRYLPPPNAFDISHDNQNRYDAYRERASFVNFTGFTKDGMIGMAFRVPPVFELPPTLEYLRTNINGDGLYIEQLAIDCMGELLEAGRYGLLADYPVAEPGLTQAQVSSLDLSAIVKSYEFENILNWRTESFGSSVKLTMVVLQEQCEEIDADGFGVEIKTKYRVLKLVDGVYMQDVYNDKMEIDEVDITPRQSNGSTWDIIPFVFVGAQNNDATVDKAPLYDLAEINIAHYRNSADYEESSFMVGQPWPVITGLSQGWVDTVLKDGVSVGSRSALLLPEGADAKLVQADSNQLPLAGMERKEKQMIMIGARIIQDVTGTETAEAAKIRFAGQNSKLGQIVTNTENAFLKVFEWLSLFMGSTSPVKITFNRKFYEATADPQMIIAMIQSLDRGVIAMTDIRETYRNVNLLSSERTDQDIDNDAEVFNPMTP